MITWVQWVLTDLAAILAGAVDTRVVLPAGAEALFERHQAERKPHSTLLVLKAFFVPKYVTALVASPSIAGWRIRVLMIYSKGMQIQPLLSLMKDFGCWFTTDLAIPVLLGITVSGNQAVAIDICRHAHDPLSTSASSFWLLLSNLTTCS